MSELYLYRSTLGYLTSPFKLLDVTFQANLSWKKNFDNVIWPSSRRLDMYALRSFCGLLEKLLMKMLYFYVIQSVIEYCKPLFLGMSACGRARLIAFKRGSIDDV